MQALLWILAALTTLAAGFLTYRADAQRAVPHPWLTALLRTLLVALVWLLLLAPTLQVSRQETRQPVVVVLQDESQSIPPALKGDTATYRNRVTDLVRRLSGKYRVVTWGFGGSVQPDSLFRYGQSATDISAALERVQEYYGQQNLGAVILASDGRFNQGLHPLFQNLSLNSPLYSVAIGDTALPKDLRITNVYANRTVARNNQFEIRADVVATRSAGYNGSILLSENGATLQTTALSVPSDRFDRSVSFTVRATTPGLHHYVLLLPPAEGERNTANNRRDVFVEVVEEKKKVLIAAAAPHPDVAALREALEGLETYEVTVRMAEALPASLAEYQVIILHGLPGAGINPATDGKPVWHILTGTSAPTLQSSAASLALSPGAVRDVYPALSPSFSGFTLPQRIRVVADKLPPLSVAAGTIGPGPGAQVLFSGRTEGAALPLWILQGGTVPQALLAGEGLWRWRLYEYRFFHNHEVVDECIRQTVSLLAANVHQNPFRVELPKYQWNDGENITLNGYLLNGANEQINTPDASVTITDSAGRRQSYTFERSGNAYRLNIGILAGGTYSYSARTTYNGKTYTAAGSFVVSGVPTELMETGADYGLLYGLSRKYGGSVVPAGAMASLYDSIAANEDIRPLIQSVDQTVPLVDWKWYFFLILLVAAAEWLLRKYWLAQ